jgi:hypothetical protein
LPLSAWLFLSAFSLPITGPATGWNSFIVAILMFVVSLVPSRPLDLRSAQARIARWTH